MASGHTRSSLPPASKAGLKAIKRVLSRAWATPNPEYIDEMDREDSLPAVFSPERTPTGQLVRGASSVVRPKKMTPAKITEDLLAQAWMNCDMHETILRAAAECAGCPIDEIPEEARASVATLSLWVSTTRAAGGSIEHLREFLDRLYPKPRRMEIDANLTTRKAMISSSKNREEAEALDAYYEMLNAPRSQEPIEAEFYEVQNEPFSEAEPDLSFLD